MPAALGGPAQAASLVGGGRGASLSEAVAQLRARADGDAAVLALVPWGAGAEAVVARTAPRASVLAAEVLAGAPMVRRSAEALAAAAEAAAGAGGARGVGVARGLVAALATPPRVALARGLVGALAVAGAPLRAHAPRAGRAAPSGVAFARGGAIIGAEHAAAAARAVVLAAPLAARGPGEAGEAEACALDAKAVLAAALRALGLLTRLAAPALGAHAPLGDQVARAAAGAA